MPASRAPPSRRGRERIGHATRGRVDRADAAWAQLRPFKVQACGVRLSYPYPTMGSFEETAMAGSAQRVGWIGMGRMGYPMAERLLRAGHDVTIWNRTIAKAQPLAEAGGTVVRTPAAVTGCD